MIHGFAAQVICKNLFSSQSQSVRCCYSIRLRTHRWLHMFCQTLIVSGFIVRKDEVGSGFLELTSRRFSARCHRVSKHMFQSGRFFVCAPQQFSCGLSSHNGIWSHTHTLLPRCKCWIKCSVMCLAAMTKIIMSFVSVTAAAAHRHLHHAASVVG